MTATQEIKQPSIDKIDMLEQQQEIVPSMPMDIQALLATAANELARSAEIHIRTEQKMQGYEETQHQLTALQSQLANARAERSQRNPLHGVTIADGDTMVEYGVVTQEQLTQYEQLRTTLANYEDAIFLTEQAVVIKATLLTTLTALESSFSRALYEKHTSFDEELGGQIRNLEEQISQCQQLLEEMAQDAEVSQVLASIQALDTQREAEAQAKQEHKMFEQILQSLRSIAQRQGEAVGRIASLTSFPITDEICHAFTQLPKELQTAIGGVLNVRLIRAFEQGDKTPLRQIVPWLDDAQAIYYTSMDVLREENVPDIVTRHAPADQQDKIAIKAARAKGRDAVIRASIYRINTKERATGTVASSPLLKAANQKEGRITKDIKWDSADTKVLWVYVPVKKGQYERCLIEMKKSQKGHSKPVEGKPRRKETPEIEQARWYIAQADGPVEAVRKVVSVTAGNHPEWLAKAIALNDRASQWITENSQPVETAPEQLTVS